MRRLLVAAALLLTAQGTLAAVDDDFEEESPLPSLALGPARSAVLSGDVGWLRSGFRVDLGLGAGFDLGLRAAAFLLSRQGNGPKEGYVGLRYSPSDLGFRVTASVELGLEFVPERVGTRDLFILRGELAAGYPVAGFLPYVRVAVRGLYFDATLYSGWDRDAELGGGLERAFGKLVLGAEATTWLQPGLPGLPQWRLRAGWAF